MDEETEFVMGAMASYVDGPGGKVSLTKKQVEDLPTAD